MICKICGSSELVKAGFRKNKQRYKCIEGHVFVLEDGRKNKQKDKFDKNITKSVTKEYNKIRQIQKREIKITESKIKKYNLMKVKYLKTMQANIPKKRWRKHTSMENYKYKQWVKRNEPLYDMEIFINIAGKIRENLKKRGEDISETTIRKILKKGNALL